ncbi:MAG: hypothetical protein ACOCXA_05180, partial [Planctomycetota bacterium]
RTLIGEYDEAAGVLRSTSHGIKVVTSIDFAAITRKREYIQTHEEFLRDRDGRPDDAGLADARRLLAVSDKRIATITANIESLSQAIHELTGGNAVLRRELDQHEAKAEWAQSHADYINKRNRIDVTGTTEPVDDGYGHHYYRFRNRQVRLARIRRDQANKALREQQEDARGRHVRLAHMRNKRMALQRDLIQAKEQRRQALAAIGNAAMAGNATPADPLADHTSAVDVGMVHRLPDQAHNDIRVRNAQVKWLRYDAETALWRLGFMAQVHSLSEQRDWYRVRLALLDAEGYLLEELEENGALDPDLGGMIRATYQIPAEIAEQTVDIDISLR